MNEHLYRSRDDRMIAGVAGGLADLWDADPSLIRIVWALLVVLTGGLALLVYVVMAIVVPEEDPWPAAPAAGPAPAAPSATPAPTTDTPADAPATSGPGEDPTVATATVAAADLAPPSAAAPPSSQPLVSPAPEPGALWAAPPTDPQRAARADARANAKAARRAARAERRTGRGGLTGTMIAGGILVAIGVFFLIREWLPELSFDWFWPSLLIVAGIVLLVAAGAGRKPRDPGAPG